MRPVFGNVTLEISLRPVLGNVTLDDLYETCVWDCYIGGFV